MKYCIFIILSFLQISCNNNNTQCVIEYVNPFIGTTKTDHETHLNNSEGYGQTIPAVTAPFGMTQWVPQTRYSQAKCIAPFYYEDTKMSGFRATHWTNGSCVADYGSFTIMPVKEGFDWERNKRDCHFVIDTTTISPAYMKVLMPDSKITTELTATKRCGIFRQSWEKLASPMLFIDVNNDHGEGYIEIDPVNREIIASNPVRRIYNGSGQLAGFSGYIVIDLDCEIENFGTYSGDSIYDQNKTVRDKREMGGFVKIKLPEDGIVTFKVGTSFTSIENARANLKSEIPDWDFNKIKSNLENEWEKILNQVQVTTKNENDKVIFYSSLYRSFFHPRIFSDVDGSYVGFAGDSKVYKTENRDQYMDYQAWDIFRAQMPLLSIFAPEEYEDMLTSLIDMAEKGGWLPIFPMWNSYTSAMIGDHCIAIIGDGYLKGFDVDIDKAWAYLKKNAFESPDNYNDYVNGKGRRALQSYIQYGYIPLEDKVEEAFHKQEQVSRTLEYTYDDWVLSQVALKAGYSDEYNLLALRAKNYRNVYDSSKGWMCGRHEDGTFTDSFVADQQMSYITEGTPMHYTWFVPHDVEGLQFLMGGEDVFLKKLISFIDEGKYWHGNEPSHHIPYLFNKAGRWDLTQKTVKRIINAEYTPTPGGLSGNDDAGQMSAWYVFSAMGFYPMCPGSNEYQLSSPIFDEVKLVLNKKYYPGDNILLKTEKNQAVRIFEAAIYDKKKVTYITHDDIKKGGTVLFK